MSDNHSHVHESHNDDTVLLIGGAGKTGRRVAARLHAAGIATRLGSRSSQITFDWDDRSTWDEALAGVSKAYVTYYPDLAIPGAFEAISAFASLAARRDVQRLVILSGRGEPEAQRCEGAVLGSGVPATVVRCSWFAQNFSEDFLLDFVRGGVISLPAADVAEPFVDVEDIADVVVAALTEPGHAGRVYELSGPESLTFADVAGELSNATGRTISYRPVSRDDFVSAAVAGVLPADQVEPLADLFTHILDGRNSSVQSGVQEALGRPPRSFADYARAAASTGVWLSGEAVAR